MTGYMLSPVGVIVIALYSVLILLAFWLLSWLPPRLISWVLGHPLTRWVRWVLWGFLVPPALILLALPWLEEAYISKHFNEACQDAGVKVYRQVEVEGYARNEKYTDRSSVSTGVLFTQYPSQQADFEREGYRFEEYLLTDGGARHLEREGEQLVVSIRDKPESRYYYEYAYQPSRHVYEKPIGWKLQKTERRVIDSQTGEILGLDIRIRRVLPTHEALIVGLFARPIIFCPSPEVEKYMPQLPFHQPKFPQSILNPVSNK